MQIVLIACLLEMQIVTSSHMYIRHDQIRCYFCVVLSWNYLECLVHSCPLLSVYNAVS